jgi:hypothetical protein
LKGHAVWILFLEVLQRIPPKSLEREKREKEKKKKRKRESRVVYVQR